MSKSTEKSKKQVQAGQYDLFGGISDVSQLIDPHPKIIELHGTRVVGVVVPESKKDIPGYLPEALKIARELVPEVQTSGRPPWLNAKWQAKRRKRKAQSG